MMLAPNERLSIYDLARPPSGCVIDALVVCTYSAAIDTMLSLPAAMLADMAGAQPRGGSFTAIGLAALKRVCERTLIFCQQAAIHPAERVTPAIIEVEPMLREVALPEGGSFHPKLWLIRFRHRDGDRTMLRLAVLSRNLTPDRSWDLGLVLDGHARQRMQRRDDLGNMLRALPGLCVRPLEPARVKLLAELVDQAEGTSWRLPDGLRNLSFHALGVPHGRGWTQPECDRLAILSPFLSPNALKGLSRRAVEPAFLLSRSDTLKRCWSAASRFSTRLVLAPPADPLDSFAPHAAGELHGKALLWDKGSRTFVALGSMNATAPAVGGHNVEFMASADCSAALGEEGILALLGGGALGAVTEEYEPDPSTPAEPVPYDERPARAVLVACAPYLRCDPAEEGWELVLCADRPVDSRLIVLLPGLRFRPCTLSAEMAAPCLADLVSEGRSVFPKALELAETTGFTVFEADGPDGRIRFTLNLEVRGVSDVERRHAALRALLPTRQHFLDFVRILLGDFASLEQLMRAREVNGGGSALAPGPATPGLLELLVRCATDDPVRLRDIGETLRTLDPEQLSEIAPEAFRTLWTELSAAAA